MSFPRRGEIYWVALDPTMGSEIAKTRPAAIISNDTGNEYSARVIVAPLTSARRRLPFRVDSHIAGRSGQIALDQIRAAEKPGPAFWAGLAVGSGALAMLAPAIGERIPLVSFLALPPAAWPQRFLTPWAGYVGWSALVPFIVALLARLSARPLQNAFGAAAAGLAFGWAGTLLHAALWRTVALPWMPSLLMPFWLLASALVAWVAGRGLLARESLR